MAAGVCLTSACPRIEDLLLLLNCPQFPACVSSEKNLPRPQIYMTPFEMAVCLEFQARLPSGEEDDAEAACVDAAIF